MNKTNEAIQVILLLSFSLSLSLYHATFILWILKFSIFHNEIRNHLGVQRGFEARP